MSELTATFSQSDPTSKPFSFWKSVFRLLPGDIDPIVFWSSKAKFLIVLTVLYGATRAMMFLSGSFFPILLPLAVIQIATQSLFSILHLIWGLPLLAHLFKRKHFPLLLLQIGVFANFFAHVDLLPLINLSSFAGFANFGLCVVVWLTYHQEVSAAEIAKTAARFKKQQDAKARHWVADGQTTWVDARTLGASDVIIVLSGERIPRDGIIIAGDTSVDESDLTQTHVPCPKGKGDPVFGSSVNRDTEIQVQLQGPYEADLLPVLMQRTQNLIQEKTGLGMAQGWLLKALTALSCLGAVLVWYLEPLGPNLDAKLALCGALLFSAPLGLLVMSSAREKTIRELWQRGIVLKNAAALEKLGRLKTVFLSKTGVLTRGEYAYSQEIIQAGNNLGEFLAVIFSLESGLDHPLARAVAEHPWHNEIPLAKIINRTFSPGLGVSGLLQAPNGSRFHACVGNLRLMKRHQFQISRELKAKIDEWEDLGETVILCGYEGEVRGLMSFGDALHRHVGQALEDIRSAGIQTALITGDTEKTVTQVLGGNPFTQIYERCTPEEKNSEVLKAEKSKRIFALVRRNAPNFESAAPNEVTIALNAGLHIRDHAADVVVMNSEIENVGFALVKAKALHETMQWGTWGSLLISATAATAALMLHPLTGLGISVAWTAILTRRLLKR